MKIAKETLKLDTLQIICPGHTRFPLSEDIEAIGLDAL